MDLETAGKLLSNLSKDDLFKIIITLCSYSEEAEEWLLDHCEEHGKVGDEELLAQEQVEYYLRRAKNVIDRAEWYGGPDEEGEDRAFLSIAEISELVKSHSFSRDFRRSVLDRLLEQFLHNDTGLEDPMIDACTDLCVSDEEFLYLAERLKNCNSQYYRKYAARLFLEHGDEDSFVEIQSKILEYGSDYIAQADFYVRKGQQDRAVRLVERAAAKVDSRLDEVYEWLFKVYSKSGQEDKLISLYWRECEDLCALINKKYYPTAVSVLKEIKAICDKSHMEAEWQAKLAAFTERHRRKKCLMELMTGEKGLA